MNNYKREAVQACADWAVCRDKQGRVWKTGFTSPTTKGDITIETETMYWRARIVQDVILARGRSALYRGLLTDLLWHYHGEGRELASFRLLPRGMGPAHISSEYASVLERVSQLLEAGDGRPVDMSAEAA
jgi:hypothetical protein